MKPEDLVLTFWEQVWNPPYNIDYVDEAVTDDFIITSAGNDNISKPAFKEWIIKFQSSISGLRLKAADTFANAEGTRVTSRWVLTGKNNGMLGTTPDQAPIRLTGIAIWEIREGKLAHNWVERSAYEVYKQLRKSDE